MSPLRRGYLACCSSIPCEKWDKKRVVSQYNSLAVGRFDSYRHDPKRFLVLSDRLALYSGVYRMGEVITDDQAGSAREILLKGGMIVETDYNLNALQDGFHLL